jgi:hypothetical protein
MRALLVVCLSALSCASTVRAQWDVSPRDYDPAILPIGRAIVDNGQTWVISLANIEPHITVILEPDAAIRIVSRISVNRRTTEIHRLLRNIDKSTPLHHCMIWSVEQPGTAKVRGTILEYRVMGVKLAECFLPNDPSIGNAHATVNIPLREGLCLIVGYGQGFTIDLSVKP